MTIQINGNYDYSKTDYEERVREKQAEEKAEKAKEAEKATEVNQLGRLTEPQDAYISSEKSGRKPTGLYRVGQDGNGNRKIFFDDPNKADRSNGKELPKADSDRLGEGFDGNGPKVNGNGQEKPEELCVTNTDKVDREIKNLKEKKRQLEQQIQSASGNEQKIRELEKKLAQVEQELSQKDNDTYRRQNASVSE